MKKYVVQTVAVYAIALVICSFINIDKIAPWYRLEFATTSDEPLSQGITAMERLSEDSGLHSVVKKLDCSTAFLFNDTYKDNSDCYLDKDLSSENADVSPDREARLRLMARVVYDRLRQCGRNSLTPRIIHADWHGAAGSLPLRRIRTVQYEAADNPGLEQQDTPREGVSVEVGASKQLLRQEAMKTPSPIVAPEAPKLKEHDLSPTSILVIGDSLAIGLARSFEEALENYDNVTFARVGKVSSGLAIPHLFDWEKKVQVLIDEYKPSFIIILMGINDANNNIRIDGEKAVLGTPFWPVAYQKRVERFLGIIKSRNVPVYWVGLPIVKDDAMTQRICLTNETAKKACTDTNDCRFIDTWQLLTDENGRYTNYKKDSKGYSVRIRAKDGIHFSREGGDLLTSYILKYIAKYVELHPKKNSAVSEKEKQIM